MYLVAHVAVPHVGRYASLPLLSHRHTRRTARIASFGLLGTRKLATASQFTPGQSQLLSAGVLGHVFAGLGQINRLSFGWAADRRSRRSILRDAHLSFPRSSAERRWPFNE